MLIILNFLLNFYSIVLFISIFYSKKCFINLLYFHRATGGIFLMILNARMFLSNLTVQSGRNSAYLLFYMLEQVEVIEQPASFSSSSSSDPWNEKINNIFVTNNTRLTDCDSYLLTTIKGRLFFQVYFPLGTPGHGLLWLLV